jgi:hypothetical protein
MLIFGYAIKETQRMFFLSKSLLEGYKESFEVALIYFEKLPVRRCTH